MPGEGTGAAVRRQSAVHRIKQIQRHPHGVVRAAVTKRVRHPKLAGEVAKRGPENPASIASGIIRQVWGF